MERSANNDVTMHMKVCNANSVKKKEKYSPIYILKLYDHQVKIHPKIFKTVYVGAIKQVSLRRHFPPRVMLMLTIWTQDHTVEPCLERYNKL